MNATEDTSPAETVWALLIAESPRCLMMGMLLEAQVALPALAQCLLSNNCSPVEVFEGVNTARLRFNICDAGRLNVCEARLSRAACRLDIGNAQLG